MNTRIIKALREFECELLTIWHDYFCKDEITITQYHQKKDSALRRCKIKIDVAIEEEQEQEQEKRIQNTMRNFLKIGAAYKGGKQ